MQQQQGRNKQLRDPWTQYPGRPLFFHSIFFFPIPLGGFCLKLLYLCTYAYVSLLYIDQKTQ